jgi:hypothetical protein
MMTKPKLPKPTSITPERLEELAKEGLEARREIERRMAGMSNLTKPTAGVVVSVVLQEILKKFADALEMNKPGSLKEIKAAYQFDANQADCKTGGLLPSRDLDPRPRSSHNDPCTCPVLEQELRGHIDGRLMEGRAVGYCDLAVRCLQVCRGTEINRYKVVAQEDIKDCGWQCVPCKEIKLVMGEGLEKDLLYYCVMIWTNTQGGTDTIHVQNQNVCDVWFDLP